METNYAFYGFLYQYYVQYFMDAHVIYLYTIYWHLGKLPNDTSLMGAEGASGLQYNQKSLQARLLIQLQFPASYMNFGYSYIEGYSY